MTGTPDRRWVKIAGAALIVLASLVVLRPFLVPAAWAAILAFASWPLYARIERGVRGRTGLSALLMTLFMVLVVVVPAVLVSLALAAELQSAFAGFKAWIAGGPSPAVAALREIPGVGRRAASQVDSSQANSSAVEPRMLLRTGLRVAGV